MDRNLRLNPDRERRRRDAWCEEGRHWFSLAEADYCEACRAFLCPFHGYRHWNDDGGCRQLQEAR